MLLSPSSAEKVSKIRVKSQKPLPSYRMDRNDDELDAMMVSLSVSCCFFFSLHGGTNREKMDGFYSLVWRFDWSMDTRALRSFTPFPQSAYSRTITPHEWCNHVVEQILVSVTLVIVLPTFFFYIFNLNIVFFYQNFVIETKASDLDDLIFLSPISFTFCGHPNKKRRKNAKVQKEMRKVWEKAITSKKKRGKEKLIKRKGFFFPINPSSCEKKKQIESLPSFASHPKNCWDVFWPSSLPLPRRLLIRNWRSFILSKSKIRMNRFLPSLLFFCDPKHTREGQWRREFIIGSRTALKI